MLFTDYLGEFAALGTAISFAFGSTLFTISGRSVGSLVVNRTRLIFALLFVMGLHWLTNGHPIPYDATPAQWFWLGMSGFVGFVLGDASLFQAFVMVGPRLSMLMMALAPVIATILAWAFLGEILILRELIGIMLTVGGVIFVVLEPRQPPPNADDIATPRKPKRHEDTLSNREYIIGLLLGFGGAAGQAGGAVLSKIGLANNFSPISANFIRLIIAAIIIWAWTVLRGQAIDNFRKLNTNHRAIWMIIAASFIGPVIGVVLSLYALQNAPVGIASALMALTPIFLIPVSYVVFKETASLQAVIGTIVAVIGTFLLF